MSDASDSVVDPAPHRRRQLSVWQRTPRTVRVALCLCVVLLVGSIFALERHWFRPEPNVVRPASTFDKIVANLPKVDLVLTKSSLNLVNHCIEGVITNNSASAYANIEITFFLVNSDRVSTDTRLVSIAALPPHGSTPFSTSRLGNDISEWTVKEIKGTPVSPESVAGRSFPATAAH